jgi:hypothetical protein
MHLSALQIKPILGAKRRDSDANGGNVFKIKFAKIFVRREERKRGGVRYYV